MAAYHPRRGSHRSSVHELGENNPAANKEAILRHLCANYNLRQEHITAFMATVQHECGFNPRVPGDSGTAFGICQWRFERNDGMRAFLAARPDQNPVTAQVDYAMHEMGIERIDKSNVSGPRWNAMKKAGAMFKSATTLEAANEALYHFELFGDRHGQTRSRLATARKFLNTVADGLTRFAKNLVNGAVEAASNVAQGVADAGRWAWDKLTGKPPAEASPQAAPQTLSGEHPKYVLGDSIGVGYCRGNKGKCVELAQGGYTIRRAMGQIDLVPPGKAALVFLGTNDAFSNFSKERVQGDVKAFLDKAHAQGIHVAGWVLPGDVRRRGSNKDNQMRKTAEWIKETINDYNRMHMMRKPVAPIEVRDKGFKLDDYVHYGSDAYQAMNGLVVTKLMDRYHAQQAAKEPRAGEAPGYGGVAAANASRPFPVHGGVGVRPEGPPGWNVNGASAAQPGHETRPHWWQQNKAPAPVAKPEVAH